jgi:hypothetical protein
MYNTNIIIVVIALAIIIIIRAQVLWVRLGAAGR